MTNSEKRQAKPANGARKETQENARQRPPMPPKNELFYVSETKKIREARIAAAQGKRKRSRLSRWFNPKSE